MFALTVYSLNLDSNLQNTKGQATKFIRDIILRLNVDTLEAVIMWHIFSWYFSLNILVSWLAKGNRHLRGDA